MKLWVMFNAEKILGKNNIAFMHGPEHKELRKQLLPLFTKRALSVYLPIQERIIRAHLKEWISLCEGKDVTQLRPLCRNLNIETSTTVFVGPYMSKATREIFTKLYFQMNEGLLAFPIALPGTTLWKAVNARKRIIEILMECSSLSKQKMKQGKEPECLLDFWMEEQERLLKKSQDSGGVIPPPMHSSDYDVAFTVLDFLFASQDASTSSLVWIGTLLADHPEILGRVREEQLRLRPIDEPISYELLGNMQFTRQVVKETLRYRAPATMIPHIALEDTPITDNYTIPKGTVIFPSLWCGQFQGFPNPHTYDPDRFGPERGEDSKYSQNFLAFGMGPHTCIGKEYAVNHLALFTSLLASNCTWTHKRTDKSDEIVYGPTVFPADGTLVHFKSYNRTEQTA